MSKHSNMCTCLKTLVVVFVLCLIEVEGLPVRTRRGNKSGTEVGNEGLDTFLRSSVCVGTSSHFEASDAPEVVLETGDSPNTTGCSLGIAQSDFIFLFPF